MTTTVTISVYKRRYVLFAVLSMAVFRLPLFFNKKILFYKLMGTGKGSGFSLSPNFLQWAYLAVLKSPVTEENGQSIIQNTYGSFISKWINIFCRSNITYVLQPLEGHGKWDGREPFGKLPPKSGYNGTIAVLTRATIKFNRLKSFWKHVPAVSASLDKADGLIKSYGIGEMPFFKQATLSIWESRGAIAAFAYNMQEHKEVVSKTRKEGWYKEEMFVRFRVQQVIDF